MKKAASGFEAAFFVHDLLGLGQHDHRIFQIVDDGLK